MTFKLYRADGGITVLTKDDLVRMRDYYLKKADEFKPDLEGGKADIRHWHCLKRRAEAINEVLKSSGFDRGCEQEDLCSSDGPSGEPEGTVALRWKELSWEYKKQ